MTGSGRHRLPMKPVVVLVVGVLLTMTVLTLVRHRIGAGSLVAQWARQDTDFARLLEAVVAPLLERDNHPALRQAVVRSALTQQARTVTVLGSAGAVVADSSARTVGTDLAPTLGSHWQALQEARHPLIWTEETGPRRLRYLLVPLRWGHTDPERPSRVNGAILLETNLAVLDAISAANLRHLFQVNGLFALGLLFLFLLLLWLVTKGGVGLIVQQGTVGDPSGLIPSAPGSDDLPLAALNSLTAHIAVLARDGTIVAVNEAWERFAREHGNSLQFDTGVGANYLEVCRRASGPCADPARKVLLGLQAVLDGTLGRFTFEYGCGEPAPERRFLMSATPFPWKDGGAVVAHVDVSEVHHAELDTVWNARLGRLFATIPVGLIYLTPDFTVSHCSRPAIEYYGLPAANQGDRPLPEMLAPERWAKLRPVLKQVLATSTPFLGFEEETYDGTQSDRLRIFRSDYYPDRNEDGTIRGIYGVTLDLSREKSVQQDLDRSLRDLQAKNRELDQMAIRDALTGLHNRRYFDEALDQEWRMFQRTGEGCTVIIMDVDAFKGVNDRHGHEAGDRALQKVATALRDTLRDSDLVARVGAMSSRRSCRGRMRITVSRSSRSSGRSSVASVSTGHTGRFRLPSAWVLRQCPGSRP